MRRILPALPVRPAVRGAIALLGLAVSVQAQKVPVTTLSNPDVVYAEPFTTISSIRELRDGRVIVADRTEKSVQLIDLREGKATPVGRVGEGPGEYGIPGRLLALPLDSTLLTDLLNLRYLVITPEGKAAATFVLDERADRRMVGLASSVDEQGRFFFVAPRYGPRGASGFSDQLDEVVFWRARGSQRADTIATLSVPPGRQTGARTVPGGKLYNYTNRPLHPEDIVAFSRDGRTAVVRASGYRVEWIAPDGRVVKGPPVPFEPVRITEAEKRAFIEAQTRPGKIITYGPPGGTSAPPPPSTGGSLSPKGGSVPAVPRGFFEDKDMQWPAVKPPFLAGAAAVAPDGRLWVLRTRAHNDSIPTYDIFDARGVLIERVGLPKRTRLVGFGAASVYLAHQDEDELQYLRRYRAP